MPRRLVKRAARAGVRRVAKKTARKASRPVGKRIASHLDRHRKKYAVGALAAGGVYAADTLNQANNKRKIRKRTRALVGAAQLRARQKTGQPASPVRIRYQFKRKGLLGTRGRATITKLRQRRR